MPVVALFLSGHFPVAARWGQVGTRSVRRCPAGYRFPFGTDVLLGTTDVLLGTDVLFHR